MKNFILISSLLLLVFPAFSQEKPIKVVFDVSSDDPKIHQSAMRHVKVMAESYPDSQFEVVVYSGSIDMVLADKSSVKDDILGLKDNENVTFKVCSMTMARKGVDASQLIEGVEPVPDGIMEIVSKQSEGWGYIKESH